MLLRKSNDAHELRGVNVASVAHDDDDVDTIDCRPLVGVVTLLLS